LLWQEGKYKNLQIGVLFWFNSLLGKPEGSNHPKENCQIAKADKAD
jgi:hypothetical protein